MQLPNLQVNSFIILKRKGGSLFLFNRKEVKFRKDGVNWKKQKDGKTVRESHEKLRVGGNKLLSCCYAQCEDVPTFRRRVYWLLDGDSGTALVHYLDEKMMSERGSV